MATANKVEINVTADPSQAVAGLGTVKNALADAGQKGASSADQINSAWSVLGSKSFADVQAEVKKVNAALDVVRANSKNPLEIKAATEAAQAKIKSLEDGLNTAKTSAGGLGSAFGQIGPLIAGAFTGRELVKTITDADSLKRGLVSIAGSTKAAEAELAFIKKTSNELGLELSSTGKAYLQLTAATKGTEIEGSKTRDIFTAVSRAMSQLGKSSAETENALRAVSQIASKGTVSMEELRGQLGEALPGAMKAAADGMGVTVQELDKMVSSGSVLAKDLLPKLALSLDKIYATGGRPDGLTAEFNRFKNKVSEVAIELGESGLTKALSDTAIAGAQTVGVLGKAFVGLGKGIGEVAAAVVTLDFKPIAEDIGLTRRAAGDFNNVMFDALGNVIGQSEQAQVAVEGLTGGVQATAVASSDAGNAAKEAFRKTEIAATNADDGLSRTAKNAVAEFDKLTAGGDTAAEAVAKIGKDFDLGNVPGIKDAAGVLGKLANDGKVSAQEFKNAWTNSLKGVDLVDFEKKAREAFTGPLADAKVLQQAIDAGLREAVKRAGLDFAVISGGMGAAATSAIADTQSIINNLDGLKKQGVDTAQVLTASIGKSINTADSAKAIDTVKQQIESLRKTLGDKLTDGLLDQATTKAKELAAALDAAKPGVNSLAEAMKTLGITTDESLRKTAATSKEAYDAMRESGKASARELSAGFQKAANDAIEANKGIAPSWVLAEAGARGFELAADNAGKTTVRAMGAAGNAVDGLRTKVQAATVDFEKQAKTLDDLNSKYGQGNADSSFKTAKVGSGEGSVLGTDRASRLAGQNAVDNSLIYTLKEKARKGTLTAKDVDDLKGVIAALDQNEQVFRDLDRYNPGGISTEASRARQENQVTRRLFQDQVNILGGDGGGGLASAPPVRYTPPGVAAPAPVATPAPTPAPAPTTGSAQTFHVRFELPGGQTSQVDVSSERDAQTLMQTLRNARLAA